jgi:hypothetical protein
MVEDLTATCERQTAAVTRLTTAVEQLTAQRARLGEAAARAYEEGYNAYLAYTNDYLEAHQGARAEYLHTREGVVVDPAALSTIDPRPPDRAVRLCHACHGAME